MKEDGIERLERDNKVNKERESEREREGWNDKQKAAK